MSALDSHIDDLYQLPLGEFTAARNALAKTLSGADAARVRALAKPTVVPWAVNLLYWQARATFDRLRKAGEQLRTAQIATLKGRKADVRAASEAHRKAIADAASHASALAARAGSTPEADELTRTLEALSIAAQAPEQPGRLTRALKPAGFEVLTGVPFAVSTKDTKGAKDTRKAEQERREKEEARKKEETRKRAEAEAEAAVERATATEAQAKKAWERAKRDLEAAERRLELVRSNS